ncbi:MAG: hypothetical protein KIT14_08270 [bacterium]|nr:hypothetical protein [bacterium]
MRAGAGVEGSGGRWWTRACLTTAILVIATGDAAALEPGEYRLPFGRNTPGLTVGPETPTGLTPVVLFFGETVQLRLTVVEPTDGGMRSNGDLFFGSGGVAYDFVRGPITIRPLVSFDTDHDGLSTLAGIAFGIGF